MWVLDMVKTMDDAPRWILNELQKVKLAAEIDEDAPKMVLVLNKVSHCPFTFLISFVRPS